MVEHPAQRTGGTLKVIISLAFLAITTAACVYYVVYIRSLLYFWMEEELERTPAQEDIGKEWYDLSWNGSNPLRVVALANQMTDTMDPYQAAKHMTSSFYSQVKYLLRGGRLLRAIVFYLESGKWSMHTLERLERMEYAREEIRPIDLEILGSPDFMLANAPYVGWLIGKFGFRKRALDYLLAANKKLDVIFKQPGATRPEPISAALIWSKIYALTGNEIFKNRVRIAELTKDHDVNQVGRIARHLGFKTVDELYQFCNI